jgi:nucleoid DNA-binding protein
MIKSELVKRAAEKNLHLHKAEVQKVVDAIFDRIELALMQRDRVELRGFGEFGWHAQAKIQKREPSLACHRHYTPHLRLPKKCTFVSTGTKPPAVRDLEMSAAHWDE